MLPRVRQYVSATVVAFWLWTRRGSVRCPERVLARPHTLLVRGMHHAGLGRDPECASASAQRTLRPRGACPRRSLHFAVWSRPAIAPSSLLWSSCFVFMNVSSMLASLSVVSHAVYHTRVLHMWCVCAVPGHGKLDPPNPTAWPLVHAPFLCTVHLLGHGGVLLRCVLCGQGHFHRRPGLDQW